MYFSNSLSPPSTSRPLSAHYAIRARAINKINTAITYFLALTAVFIADVHTSKIT